MSRRPTEVGGSRPRESQVGRVRPQDPEPHKDSGLSSQQPCWPGVPSASTMEGLGPHWAGGPPNPTGSHSLTGVPESAPRELEDRRATASHSSLAARSTVTGVLVPRSDARNRTALGPSVLVQVTPSALGWRAVEVLEKRRPRAGAASHWHQLSLTRRGRVAPGDWARHQDHSQVGDVGRGTT